MHPRRLTGRVSMCALRRTARVGRILPDEDRSFRPESVFFSAALTSKLRRRKKARIDAGCNGVNCVMQPCPVQACPPGRDARGHIRPRPSAPGAFFSPCYTGGACCVRVLPAQRVPARPAQAGYAPRSNGKRTGGFTGGTGSPRGATPRLAGLCGLTSGIGRSGMLCAQSHP